MFGLSSSQSNKVWAVLAVIGLAWSSACDSGAPPTFGTTPSPDQGVTAPQTSPDASTPPVERYTLTIVGPSSFTLKSSEQATLKVSYMKNETLLTNKPITFAIKGDAHDTALSTLTAMTNNIGVAETKVTAGQVSTTFKVEASADYVDPVSFDLEVIGPPPVPKLSGSFELISNFDVNTKFTGSSIADVLNTLEEMSNHSNDPGRYIVDIVFDAAFQDLDPSTKAYLDMFRPFLYDPVQQLLMDTAPNLTTDIKNIGKSLSDLSRRFQVTSTMKSSTEQPSDQPMLVSHKIEKIGWTLSGRNKVYTYNDLGLTNPQVDNVKLVLSNTTALSISSHTIPLQFGSFLLVGLNELVIPAINPNATSFAQLLAGWVDCAAVAQTIDDNTGNTLGVAFWAAACDTALQLVGDVVEQQITKIDVGTSDLEISGTCKLTDKNSDSYLDSMSGGLWTGTFNFAGNAAPITGTGNNFTGIRK